jgi:hypothetical protein
MWPRVELWQTFSFAQEELAAEDRLTLILSSYGFILVEQSANSFVNGLGGQYDGRRSPGE